MIRFALACDQGHEFESWFPSGASYDDQAARGLVACPFCDSTRIEKRLMAPAIAKRGPSPASPEARATPPSAEPASGPEAQPVAVLSEREAAMRALMRAMREHVTKTADYVGGGFADEARRMHYGELPHRSIYGEANAADAQALIEEGIEVHPLPLGPDDRN